MQQKREQRETLENIGDHEKQKSQYANSALFRKGFVTLLAKGISKDGFQGV